MLVGKLTCERGMASVKLVIGGTVSENGTLVTAAETAEGVTVTFDKGEVFALSLIVDETLGTNVPETSVLPKKSPQTFLLRRADFGFTKPPTIVACGHGL